jgi:hypothetical protein
MNPRKTVIARNIDGPWPFLPQAAFYFGVP